MSEQQANYLGISVADWADLLRAGDPLERRLAAHALSEIGPAASEATPILAAALADPASFVRVWAAAALARVDPSREEVLTALVAGMKDEYNFVRSLAAWHLGRLGPEFPCIGEFVPKLRDLLLDVDPSVGTEATLALRTLEGKGAPPLELLSLSRPFGPASANNAMRHEER